MYHWASRGDIELATHLQTFGSMNCAPSIWRAQISRVCVLFAIIPKGRNNMKSTAFFYSLLQIDRYLSVMGFEIQTRISVLGALYLLASGCSTLTPIDPPSTTQVAPSEWAFADPAPLETSIASYWDQLDDLLLSEYVERAIANNRDLAVSAAQVAQARAGVRAARANYLPQVDASGGMSRDIGDLSADDFQFSLGADARWETDLFGRISYDVAANLEALRGAEFALADVQRLIVGQVAQTTISARALAVQLEIARSTLEIQDENLQIARWRLQAGLVSSLDVEQAKAQRAQTAATIPALERDLVASANAISILIGEPPGAVHAALSGAAKIPVAPSQVGFAAPAEVLRNRPDVRRAEARLLEDSARIGVARAQLLPLVSLSGTIGTNSTGLDDIFDIITGRVFANVAQLIFDGGRRRAQIAGAEARADASRAAWEQSILLALGDIENASVALNSARERVVILGDALDASQNAVLIARSQYQAGLIDFESLLIAENQLLVARNSLAAAEAERANSFVVLTQSLGGGWQDGQEPSADGNDMNEGIVQ